MGKGAQWILPLCSAPIAEITRLSESRARHNVVFNVALDVDRAVRRKLRRILKRRNDLRDAGAGHERPMRRFFGKNGAAVLAGDHAADCSIKFLLR